MVTLTFSLLLVTHVVTPRVVRRNVTLYIPTDKKLFKVSKITSEKCSFERFFCTYFIDFEQVFASWDTSR